MKRWIVEGGVRRYKDLDERRQAQGEAAEALADEIMALQDTITHTDLLVDLSEYQASSDRDDAEAIANIAYALIDERGAIE